MISQRCFQLLTLAMAMDAMDAMAHIKEPPSSKTVVFPATVQEPRIHQQRSACWTRGQLRSPELLRAPIRPRQDTEPLLEVGIIVGPWKPRGKTIFGNHVGETPVMVELYGAKKCTVEEYPLVN